MKKENLPNGYNLYLFEFHQSHHPKIVWNEESSKMESINQFLWYVVSTPNDFDNDISVFRHSIVFSQFSGYFYIAIYFKLVDVEARGFIRSVVFCITNKDSNKINGLRKYSSNFLDSCKILFDSSMQVFKNEFEHYASSLSTLVSHDSNCSHEIFNYHKEIGLICEKIGVCAHMIDDAVPDSSYFFQIRNSLRDLEIISNLSYFSKNVISNIWFSSEKFLLSFHEKIICQTKLRFGGIHSDNTKNYISYASMVLNDADHIKTELFSIVSLVNSKVAYHCIHALMSGTTLIIQCSQFEEAKSLAARLSIFIPDYHEEYVCFDSGVMKPSYYMQFGIIVTSNVELFSHNSFSVLNLDLGVFEGILCPQNSMVFRDFNFSLIESESSLLLYSLCKLQELEYRFTMISTMWMINVPTSMKRVLPQLNEQYFTLYDEQTLAYWLYVANNNHKSKPVLLNQKAKGGRGIIVFS